MRELIDMSLKEFLQAALGALMVLSIMWILLVVVFTAGADLVAR